MNEPFDMEAAYEQLGEMVRERIFDRDDGLEMLLRLKAGSVAMIISAHEVTFLDVTKVGLVTRQSAS